MKSLCIIAICTMTFGYSSDAYSQGWKDKLGIKKSGKVMAKDLSEEDVEALVYHKRKTDDGVVGEYQQANLNKVVFSGKKLTPAEVNAGNVKQKFSINDPVYFNVILPQSLPNYVVYPEDDMGEYLMDYSYDYSFKKWYAGTGSGAYNTDRGLPVRNVHGSTDIEIYLDGELIDCPISLRGVGTSSTQTIYSDWIFDDPAKHDPQPDWASLVQDLPEGEHDVKLIVYSKTTAGQDTKSAKAPIAEGSFILVKNPGETFAPKFDLSWKDYKAGLNESALNSSILKAIQNFGSDNKYKEVFDAVKVSSRAWIITRNPVTSIVTGRYVVVYCKAKWPDGFCKVQKFIFRQDHNGTGFQTDNTYCMGVYRNTGAKSIDCD